MPFPIKLSHTFLQNFVECDIVYRIVLRHACPIPQIVHVGSSRFPIGSSPICAFGIHQIGIGQPEQGEIGIGIRFGAACGIAPIGREQIGKLHDRITVLIGRKVGIVNTRSFAEKGITLVLRREWEYQRRGRTGAGPSIVYPIISRRDFTSIRAYGEIHRSPVRTNRIAIERNSHKYFAFIAAPRITVVIAAEQVFIRFGQSMIRPGIVPSDYFFTLGGTQSVLRRTGINRSIEIEFRPNHIDGIASYPPILRL